MKKIDLKLREATLKDMKLIMYFQDKMVHEERRLRTALASRKKNIRTYTRKELKEIVRSPNGCFVFAEAKGKAIGCGYAKIEDVFGTWCKYKKRGYLGQLYVEKKYRKMGVGKGLVDYRIKWLKSKGIKFIVLKVYAHNYEAVNLFRKRGFKDYLLEMRL